MEDVLKLLTNATRVRVLRELAQAEGPMSPRMLCDVLPDGESLGVVAYHVRKLYGAGVIELAQERMVRGAVEHLYRPVPAAAVLLAAADLDDALRRARARIVEAA